MNYATRVSNILVRLPLLIGLLLPLLSVSASESNLMSSAKTTKEFMIDGRDGKKYATTVIGKARWMAENLAYYGEGVPKDDSLYSVGGGFYTWTVAQSVCPMGWHLPSQFEWDELIAYAGGDSLGLIRLKSGTGWDCGGCSSGYDSYGFNMKPYGGRNFEGFREGIGLAAIFWSSSSVNVNSKFIAGVQYDFGIHIFKYTAAIKTMNAVRCVEDVKR
jgi:uncharacterized protein (TIGR02145 family)